MVNGDSDSPFPSQSKRPAPSQHDSDSQVSDHASRDQHGHGAQPHHRPKTTKHVVGGRPHARVPSSKALHKPHGSTSSAKLTRRQASPSPEAFPPVAAASGHRRATSDLNLSRDASATNLLKKNASHSSLKRNRSKVEVGKKSKSSTNLKRAGGSSTAVHKHHHKTVNQVHFNLGDEEDEDDENQEDEWVDASASVSPLLSRRTSVVSGGHSSTAASVSASTNDSRPSTATEQKEKQSDTSPRNGTDSPSQSLPRTNHKEYLTSRLLERSSSNGAPPIMSTETASVRPPSSRAHSPDSEGSPKTGSTVSGTPRLGRPSSSGKAELTSRFVTDSRSQGSGSGTGPDSWKGVGATANRGALARAANGRIEVLAAAPAVKRPKSTGNLAQRGREEAVRAPARIERETEENTVENSGQTAYIVSRLEMNRTQQKINLQRASSSLEPTIPNHPGIGLSGGQAVTGPLVGAGGGYGGRDAVLPKVLERTGMEYLIVRRYQNPIARSLTRLSQLPGADKNRRIPKPGTPSATSGRSGHSRASSEQYGGLRSGPVQNLRDREAGRDSHVAGLGLIGGQAAARRPTSRRGYPVGLGLSGTGLPLRGEVEEQVPNLSGSSLVDGGEDAQTVAILRNLWDKNMDLSASQE